LSKNGQFCKFRLAHILLISILSFWFVGLHSRHEETAPSVRKLSDSPMIATTSPEKPRKHTAPQAAFDEATDTRVVVDVFYHTYAGPTEEHQIVSRRVVQQQLEYLGQASQQNRGFKFILHYTSVGNATVLSPDWVQSLCREYSNNTLSCLHLGHMDQGHEESTLQQLHSHCRSVDDNAKKKQEHLVVYIHSKGAFLHKEAPAIQALNEKWMPPLTLAPITPACLASLLPKTAGQHHSTPVCNVCGLQFYPMWSLFYPGNMFSAHCSYVSQLLPVHDYATQMQELATQIRSMKPRSRQNQQSTFPDTIWTHMGYKNSDDHYGVGRYSNEHWVGSHPQIRPCDMTPAHQTRLFSQLPPDEVQRIFEQSDSLVQPAPRVPLFQGKWYRFRPGQMKNLVDTAVLQNHQRPHSYFLLPGILYRMYKLYANSSKAFPPPQDSWIWDYYPHGQVWKDKIDLATRKGNLQIESMIW